MMGNGPAVVAVVASGSGGDGGGGMWTSQEWEECSMHAVFNAL
jgi:hypothetical protein